MKGFHAYMREIRLTIARTQEGCTMSSPEKAAAAAAAPNTREHYDRLLGELTDAVNSYLSHKRSSRQNWCLAEERASLARKQDKDAAEALRRAIKILPKIVGTDAMNALVALATLDDRSGELWGNDAEPRQVPNAGDTWDRDDRVTLADQAEDQGHGDH
jgi:hypothetical protein